MYLYLDGLVEAVVRVRVGHLDRDVNDRLNKNMSPKYISMEIDRDMEDMSVEIDRERVRARDT
jgi:hypothetical protein